MMKKAGIVVDFLQVETEEHKQQVRVLIQEYMEYAVRMFEREFGVTLDVGEFVERDMAGLQKFSPPQGRLLLVEVDGDIAGMGALRQIGERIGEVKRMYIRPAFRGRGLGRGLLERLVEEARLSGYTRLRLDFGPFAKAAEQLYRSAGFNDIEPYAEAEMPPEYHDRWQFLEQLLS
jgi:GNAT superfamily N-acetyltransferase